MHRNIITQAELDVLLTPDEQLLLNPTQTEAEVLRQSTSYEQQLSALKATVHTLTRRVELLEHLLRRQEGLLKRSFADHQPITATETERFYSVQGQMQISLETGKLQMPQKVDPLQVSRTVEHEEQTGIATTRSERHRIQKKSLFQKLLD